MPSLLDILLILMLQLNVILDLVLDELMLIGKGLLEYINPILLLIQVIIDPLILMLIILEFILQDCVLL